MASRVVTVAFQGVEARRVDVEVQLTGGEMKFMLVGLGDKAVAESRERVRAAFAGLGLAMPSKRIIANLAPADLPKEGSHYDLPIALAVMAAMGILPPDALTEWAAMGELSLDGRIVGVSGALPAAVAAGAMGLGLICPEASVTRYIHLLIEYPEALQVLQFSQGKAHLVAVRVAPGSTEVMRRAVRCVSPAQVRARASTAALEAE